MATYAVTLRITSTLNPLLGFLNSDHKLDMLRYCQIRTFNCISVILRCQGTSKSFGQVKQELIPPALQNWKSY